jgi:hypothetical protein
MQQGIQAHVGSRTDLNDQVRLLATVEPSETGFVSCYVDGQLGREGCINRIERQAEGLRSDLSGSELLDFEGGLALVKQEVRQAWHPQARGLAVFARGIAGGRFVTHLGLAVPLANRLAFYRVPDIGPLVSLQHATRSVGLVLVRRGAIQVFDLDMGSAVLRAWVTAPDGAATDTTSAGAGRGHKPEANRIRLFRRVLSADTDSPLIIAGDRMMLDAVRAWLPQRAAARVADVIAVPFGFSQSDALDFIRRRAASLTSILPGDASHQWLRAMRGGGGAVAGHGATLQSLRAGSAQWLLMTPDYRPPRGWMCERCQLMAAGTDEPSTCTACDGGLQRAWDARIELTRLAVQQGVPVLLTDCDELRYLGGVGCVMAKPPAEAAAALPAPRRSRGHVLDQVA